MRMIKSLLSFNQQDLAESGLYVCQRNNLLYPAENRTLGRFLERTVPRVFPLSVERARRFSLNLVSTIQPDTVVFILPKIIWKGINLSQK